MNVMFLGECFCDSRAGEGHSKLISGKEVKAHTYDPALRSSSRKIRFEEEEDLALVKTIRGI